MQAVIVKLYNVEDRLVKLKLLCNLTSVMMWWASKVIGWTRDIRWNVYAPLNLSWFLRECDSLGPVVCLRALRNRVKKEKSEMKPESRWQRLKYTQRVSAVPIYFLLGRCSFLLKHFEKQTNRTYKSRHMIEFPMPSTNRSVWSNEALTHVKLIPAKS